MMQQIRRLTQALMVSGALNILLLALFFYWTVKDKPILTAYQLRPADLYQQQAPLADERTAEEVLQGYQHMPLEQLTTKLSNKQLVENGYTHRDLALAAMIAFRHFDLTKSLEGTGSFPPSREFFLSQPSGEKTKIDIYWGFTDNHFEKISDYASREKWPVTSLGLFKMLKEEDSLKKEDPTLSEAFYLTPEFLSVEMLFKRSGAEIEKKQLLQIILEGPWDALNVFATQQKQVQDLSAAKRQQFLLDYIAKGSKTAAQILLKTDSDFAVRKVDDKTVMTLLRLLDEPTPQAKTFALDVLSSPRHDGVRHLAAARLYEYAGERIPTAFTVHDALLRFLNPLKTQQTKSVQPPLAYVSPTPTRTPTPRTPTRLHTPTPTPSKTPTKTPTPSKTPVPTHTPYKTPSPKKPSEIIYLVKEGDSLWKIARTFNVDIDDLQNLNNLTSDKLKPGMSIKIPVKSNSK